MHNGNEAGLSEPQTKSDMPTLKDQAQDVVRESLAENSSNNNTMTLPLRGNDLPPEIMHISDGCIPLSKIITRLAQLCHNQLSDKIRQIALMPMPTPQQPSIVNGQVHSSALGQKEEFDQSNESVARKVALNQAIQKMHGKWVKTLVIADWSRRSQDVSKLIDLKSHLGQVMTEYELRLDQMINVKRDLTFARLPSPDLKTALHVLSTGDGSYLPDFQFIEPEPMTNQEMMKWIENVNTLLTIRLSLDDYDNIPVHFHDYTIRDGRVVFSVEGEFEVELTIADEDPAQQFWFVDFRFKFSPAPSEISLSLRMYLETMVNNAIAKDNLTGCYNFLHEFVLTHKINEMKRQAIELSKTSWGGVLSIETLDRAFSAQYWPNRPGPNGSKHWIIVAVDGKKKKTGWVNPKTASNLVATWFRDGKPVKGDKVLFDTVNLSMEQLVVTVVSRHMEYIFMSIYNNLATNHIYSSREAHLSVTIDPEYPAKSSLTMQCSHEESITVIVEPTTGEFKLKSHSKASHQAELKLNKMTPMWYSSCIVRVLDKKKFRSLGANMSRDIRYNGRTGEFCIRIFRPLNTAIRPLLKPRLEAIDRVVNFLDAMTKAGPCVKCESVTLKRITFSYSEAGVRLDKPFIPTSANEPPPPKWTVVLDLRKSDQIAVILSDKDPHQLVGGMLTRIANQWGGLRTLIRTLPRTLAVMDAIAEIVNGSPERDALCKGVVRSLHLSAGASSLIYHLSSGTGLRLDIKARIRSGAIWWTLERVAMNGQSFTAQAGADDEEVASRLKSLFSMSDPDGRWITFGSGLTTCGVRHVKAMIKAADQKVWGL
ncbi:Mediator of RNA polymerase II transcription subunit 14 [Ceratocystis platani]|uniref:Mediator of RNA polymerase II transcription subunit 14 n=1 Tax=Ceratocystis fimbriata f. sp. platani TaxID=88771 RepID=A0A0F8BU67_CERFI|nr:Mediator of RNA polymerase II transcription subunit 14 [Ceratocystis platani]